MKNIESIINPKSIAVVGATNRPGSVGLATFKNLLQTGYKGALYPVNPKSKSIQGVRGNPPADIEAIKLSILRLSQMVSDHPEISELDINPLIVYPQGQGCMVADSRILLTQREE